MCTQIDISQLLEVEKDLFLDNWCQALNLSDKDSFLNLKWLNILLSTLWLDIMYLPVIFLLRRLGDGKFFVLDLK